MKQTVNNRRLSIIRKFGTAALIMVICVVLLPDERALAMRGGPYQLTWSTIDGGGATSTDGLYVLSGTIAQPDVDWMAGGDYEVLGGFWPGPYGCFVDFETFARFAKYWLETGTGLPADLHEDENNIVNWLDMKVFADYWLCYCPLGWQLK